MKPSASCRFDREGHWPIYDKKSSRSLCKIKCCQNRTHVYCEKCDIHLYFNATRNCFYEYHTQNIDLIESRGERQPKKVKSTKKTRPSIKQSHSCSTVPGLSMASNSMGGVRKMMTAGSSKTKKKPANINVPTKSASTNPYCLRRQIAVEKISKVKPSGKSSKSSAELFSYLKLTKRNG